MTFTSERAETAATHIREVRGAFGVKRFRFGHWNHRAARYSHVASSMRTDSEISTSHARSTQGRTKRTASISYVP